MRLYCAALSAAEIKQVFAGGESLHAVLSGLSDGEWHQLTCTRTDDKVTITVDGSSLSNDVSLGRIANSSDVTIGAKPTGGDAFRGRIDQAFIDVG